MLIQYIKPMQCGGSDERFVKHVVQLDQNTTTTTSLLYPYQANTLVAWETPASPHTSSRIEGLPCSDEQILDVLRKQLDKTVASGATSTIVWCETAGGVLSPGPSSPDNDKPWHARQASAPSSSPGAWGWQPQADLYRRFASTGTVVLVGDARLGGISATLSSLESLISRGYRVPAIVVINPVADKDVHANAKALREYTSGRYDHPIEVLDLPPIPPDPTVPLDDWYRSEDVVNKFEQLHQHLRQDWIDFMGDEPVLTKPPLDTSLALRLARTWSQYGKLAFDKEEATNTWMDHLLDENDWAHDAKVQASNKDAVAWAKQAALATYQKRMRVTDEQKDNMEWAICRQSLPELYHSEGKHDHDSEEEEEEEDEEEEEFSWVSAKNLVLDAPTIAFQKGKLRIRFPEGLESSPDTTTEFESMDKALDIVARRVAPKLYSQYKELIEMQWLVYEHSGINRKIGAILLEPVLSRDHVWVDPLWQRALIEIGEARNIPIIYDETGLDLGMKRGYQALHVKPDIAILRNTSSASALPQLTTLYTEEVCDVIAAYSESDDEEVYSKADGVDYLVSAHQLHMKNMAVTNNSPRLIFAEEQIRKLSEMNGVEECFALGNVVSASMTHTIGDTTNEIAERIRPKVVQSEVMVRANSSRIVVVVDPFIGREERRTIVERIRQELE